MLYAVVLSDVTTPKLLVGRVGIRAASAAEFEASGIVATLRVNTVPSATYGAQRSPDHTPGVVSD